MPKRRDMIIKVCGVLNNEHFNALTKVGVSWAGFNFYKESKRFYKSNKISNHLDVTKVGVFVNATLEYLEQMMNKFDLDYLQLHGKEDQEYCMKAQSFAKVIKVFSVNESFDFNQTKNFGFCEYFLFDTKCIGHGGSGQKFDWNKLKEYEGDVGFLLAGGVSINDVGLIQKINHKKLLGVDINSKFEVRPGIKDVNLVHNFIKQFKNNQHEQ